MADQNPDPLKQAEDTAIAVVEEAPPKAKEKRTTKEKKKTKKQPNYHVVIWNDEEHSYEYVIKMLMVLFSHPYPLAVDITTEVDKKGKGIAYTCHLELAELKRDQILAWGADPTMKESTGPIRATIEEAPE